MTPAWEPNYEIPPMTSIDEAASLMLDYGLAICGEVRADFNGYRLTSGPGMKTHELVQQFYDQRQENARLELVTRIENERRARDWPKLVDALKALEAALGTDSRQKSIARDTVEYHLDGQAMYAAINKARDAIALAEGPPL